MALNKSKIKREYLWLRRLYGGLGSVLPGLMADSAYMLWCKTRRIATPKHEFDFIEKSRRQTLTFGQSAVRTYLWGEGPLILLVHGWNGRAAQFMQLAQALVDAGYGVLGFDAPGHGNTEGEGTNLLEISQIILALRKKYGLFHSIIGHSFGCSCITYAFRQQDVAQQVVCLAPSVFFERRLIWFIKALNMPPRMEKRFRARFVRIYGADWQRELSAIHSARSIKHPVLVIHDSDDRVIDINESRALVRMLPEATLTITQGLGHWRLLHNSATIDSVVQFCGKQRIGSLESV